MLITSKEHNFLPHIADFKILVFINNLMVYISYIVSMLEQIEASVRILVNLSWFS